MNHLKAILTILTLSLFTRCSESITNKSQLVNSILGDISYEIKFGTKPDATTDNDLRIKTHLEYVETLLRNSDVSTLSSDQQRGRAHLLDLLHDYWTRGVFPKNYDFADVRKPCFIDEDGTICAVGYLIEQTTSRQVAEEINDNHKYDELLAMSGPFVNEWIETCGLTKEECAMIQPTYGPTPRYTYNHISPAYGVSSSVISGMNLALNTVNGVQIGKGRNNAAVPIMGMITGIGQLALGSVMFPEEKSSFGTTYTNESQKALSLVNIGLGTTTMILSIWNLSTRQKPKEKLTSYNIYGFPAGNNNPGIGLSLSRRF